MLSTMIIDACDYDIIQNNVPVLTRTDDGRYTNTNCWLCNFDIESKNIKNVLSVFDYKSNILDSIKQFGYSPRYVPVLRILTNTSIQTPDFDIFQDLLAVALFLDKGKDKPTWLHYFEVNYNYRQNVMETPKYKTIGGSMITSLQKVYRNQGIEGRAFLDALPFYFKYGFERIDNRECYLRWLPQR